VFNWHAGHLTVSYQRQHIESAQRFEGAMPLSPAHVEALDMLDRLGNDPEMHVRTRLEKGDMQFVYNHSQLHDRTDFVDWTGLRPNGAGICSVSGFPRQGIVNCRSASHGDTDRSKSVLVAEVSRSTRS